MSDEKPISAASIKAWADSLPERPRCNHPGCHAHITHPCEECGRGGPMHEQMRPRSSTEQSALARPGRWRFESARGRLISNGDGKTSMD